MMYVFIFLAGKGIRDASQAVADKTNEFAQGASNKMKKANKDVKKKATSLRKSIENIFK